MGTDIRSKDHHTRQFQASDGVKLSADCWGAPGAPTVIFSHGGGQTRHSWGRTAQKLAEQGWYAIAYDHRGHGDSGWAPDGVYDFSVFGSDMHAITEKLGGRPHVVGASLGGLSAMICAGEIKSEAFSSITLVDVTPKLNSAGVENIFAFMTANMDSGFGSLEEAADAISEYTGRPRRTDLSGLEKNLRKRNDRYFWHWDPAFFALKDDHATHNPDRVSNALRRIEAPIMLVRGKASDIVTEAEVEEFLELAPHAEYVDVEHARHMVAGDRNDIFTAAVAEFLERQK